MLIEINLLKEKHGILDRYNKQGSVGEGIHQRRTLSILVLTALLAILVGLNYGDKLFSSASIPLKKSLNYAMELIPQIMGKPSAIPKEEALQPQVEEIDEGIGDLFEEVNREDQSEPETQPSTSAKKKEKKTEPASNQNDMLELIAQEKKAEAPAITAPPAAVMQTQPKVQKAPPTHSSPLFIQKKKPVQKVVKKELVDKKTIKTELAKKTEPPKVKPQKKSATPPPSIPAGTYINAGAYLLKTNLTKLKKIGRKQHFNVYTETVNRRLKNYFFSLGEVSEAKSLNRVRKDLSKYTISIVEKKKAGGKVEIQTTPTPLAFIAERQKKQLSKAGYTPKLHTMKKSTPLTKILVGPLKKPQVKPIRRLLKKKGFPTSLITQ